MIYANNSCEIPANMFHIDYYNQLILINKDIHSLNSNTLFPVQILKLAQEEYSFSDVIDNFEIGKKYELQKDDDVYLLYFTELPVLTVTTSTQINKENPNEMAWNDPEAGSTYMPSTVVLTESDGTTVSSNIGIRMRGALSRYFIKKSFRVEFWEDAVSKTEKDVTLLGMDRFDGDWNLQAMWHESLKLRSKVSADIWNQIHTIYYKDKEPEAKGGFEMKYVEVFVNNNYRGVYLISERYDRKQLQLKKLKVENGNVSMRGELIKTATDPQANGPLRFFTVFADTDKKETTEVDKFEYEYPDMDDDEIPAAVKGKYDWTNFRNLADFIVNSSDAEFNANYKSRLDMNSFVDNYIFLNLMKGQDNSAKNVYYGKYKENEPYFILPWDLDATWGGGVFGHIGDSPNAEIVGRDKDKNNIYVRMYKDDSVDGFPELVKKRWQVLRSSVITHDNIKTMFKTQYDYLIKNAVYDREGIRWTDFENRKTGDWGSYQNRFNYLDNWIKNRIEFLDKEFEYDPITSINESGTTDKIEITPTPAVDCIYVRGDIDDGSVIRIFDVNGRLVKSYKFSKHDDRISLFGLNSGIYFLHLYNDKLKVVSKFVIR